MNEDKETGRIEAFSDGVFAVAITLLVLDIKIPPLPTAGAAASLGIELARQWPVYIAFVTSFLTILVMWINHHRVFGLIKRSDDRFMVLNGLLLMTITLVPFTTSLVAAYLMHPDMKIAVLVYTGNSVFLALAFSGLWRYASKDSRLLAANHDRLVAEGITKSYRHGPLLYIIIFLISFVSPMASITICLLLALYFTIPPRKHAAHGK